MAAFRQLPSGLWQVQIFRRGVRRSASFASKGAAIAWAGRVEAEIMEGQRGEIPNLTVGALFDRYEREVSAGKKGRRWEAVRLRALGRDRLALVRLRVLDSPHVSDWQRRRLEAVSGASVRRERNLVNNVFQIAIKEWRWLRRNPFEGVRRPKDGKPRRRIATPAELDRLTGRASDKMRRVILFALETGMRAGEIAALREVRGRVAYVADSKNDEAREVPLSAAALAAWRGTAAPDGARAGVGRFRTALEPGQGGFGLTAGSISGLFKRLCLQCDVKGLTFHDLRGAAITRLSKKLNPLQLAKMVGHKNPKMLLVYYRETTEDVAALL